MNWFNILKLGNCYQTAYSYVFDEYIKNSKTRVLLVHADVTGTGGEVVGMCYGHAFVLDGNMVIDTEATIRLGKEIKMPYERYVDLGNVTNEQIYTVSEAMQYAMISGHYGPWHDGLVSPKKLNEIKESIKRGGQ
tara:strand:- start:620 stop:1024 length:405 start_codon:yes stop_codon:yes gene_type:complete